MPEKKVRSWEQVLSTPRIIFFYKKFHFEVFPPKSQSLVLIGGPLEKKIHLFFLQLTDVVHSLRRLYEQKITKYQAKTSILFINYFICRHSWSPTCLLSGFNCVYLFALSDAGRLFCTIDCKNFRGASQKFDKTNDEQNSLSKKLNWIGQKSTKMKRHQRPRFFKCTVSNSVPGFREH